MRKARLNAILTMIRTLQPVPYNKLRGLLAVNYGFKTDTTSNYIRELKDAEQINIENGIVTIAPMQELIVKKEVQKAETELKAYEKKKKK